MSIATSIPRRTSRRQPVRRVSARIALRSTHLSRNKYRNDNTTSLFIYPPYLKYKKPFIPFSYNLEKKIFEGSRVSRNDKYWNKIYEKIDKKYNIENKILPKDTIVFRGSTNPNPNNFNSKSKSPLIYFGLDFVISTWISLENYDRMNENDKIKNKDDIKYYLHVYKLKNPLLYKYIYEDDGTPMDLDKNNALNFPCIHPQEILHGDIYIDGNELGTELTIPRNDIYKIKEIVVPITTFEIDIQQLKKHISDYIFEWDPIHAIK
jgi:hypothetical protein